MTVPFEALARTLVASSGLTLELRVFPHGFGARASDEVLAFAHEEVPRLIETIRSSVVTDPTSTSVAERGL